MKRTGLGWDIHKLAENRPLIIGGVEIPNSKGCVGHSDGDALTHAVIDSLLGASGLGDIGEHFPDTDDQYKDISSLVLLRVTNDMLREHDYEIIDIDANIILQSPKLSPYKDAIRDSIAKTLDLDIDQVNIKAKTAEHMLGEVGTGDAIIAQAIALIEK